MAMRFPDGLLESLHEGMFEAPLWDGFVRRLQAAAGAELAMLSIRPAGQEAAIDRSAGTGPATLVRAQLVGAALREGRRVSAGGSPRW